MFLNTTNICFFLIFLVLFPINVNSKLLSSYINSNHPNEIRKSLLQNYDKDTIPYNNAALSNLTKYPLVVDVKLSIFQYKLRFKNTTQYVVWNYPYDIYTPSPFVYNSQKTNTDDGLVNKAEYLKNYHNGTVKLSTKVNFDTSCSINLELSPFREQKCEIHIQDYLDENEGLVIYVWRNLSIEQRSIGQFEIKDIKKYNYCEKIGEAFPCIKGVLLFERFILYNVVTKLILFQLLEFGCGYVGGAVIRFPEKTEFVAIMMSIKTTGVLGLVYGNIVSYSYPNAEYLKISDIYQCQTGLFSILDLMFVTIIIEITMTSTKEKKSKIEKSKTTNKKPGSKKTRIRIFRFKKSRSTIPVESQHDPISENLEGESQELENKIESLDDDKKSWICEFVKKHRYYYNYLIFLKYLICLMYYCYFKYFATRSEEIMNATNDPNS